MLRKQLLWNELTMGLICGGVCRFYGRIARGPDEHEEATLQAIQENGSGLKGSTSFHYTILLFII